MTEDTMAESTGIGMTRNGVPPWAFAIGSIAALVSVYVFVPRPREWPEEVPTVTICERILAPDGKHWVDDLGASWESVPCRKRTVIEGSIVAIYDDRITIRKLDGDESDWFLDAVASVSYTNKEERRLFYLPRRDP